MNKKNYQPLTIPKLCWDKSVSSETIGELVTSLGQVEGREIQGLSLALEFPAVLRRREQCVEER